MKALTIGGHLLYCRLLDLNEISICFVRRIHPAHYYRQGYENGRKNYPDLNDTLLNRRKGERLYVVYNMAQLLIWDTDRYSAYQISRQPRA